MSLACAHAAAAAFDQPLYRYLGGVGARTLPVPMFNILNGGKHAQDSTDFQEFMVMPVGVATYGEALRAGSEIFAALRTMLHDEGHATGRATKAASPHRSPRTRPPSRSSSARSSGPAIGRARTSRSRSTRRRPSWSSLAAAPTAAPTQYVLAKEGRTLDSGELIDLWADWIARYPIVSHRGWPCRGRLARLAAAHRAARRPVQLVGDDLLVTNTTRIARAIEQHAANSVLIKLNQIGTLTETIEAIELARGAGWSAVVSHRSGETEDTTIADLVVAMGTGQIKTGAPSRSERVAKYNRLLRIEDELGRRGALSRPARSRELRGRAAS